MADNGPEFAQVFVIVWIGAAIVTLNSKLLGGNMYVNFTNFLEKILFMFIYRLQLILPVSLRIRLLPYAGGHFSDRVSGDSVGGPHYISLLSTFRNNNYGFCLGYIR